MQDFNNDSMMNSLHVFPFFTDPLLTMTPWWTHYMFSHSLQILSLQWLHDELITCFPILYRSSHYNDSMMNSLHVFPFFTAPLLLPPQQQMCQVLFSSSSPLTFSSTVFIHSAHRIHGSDGYLRGLRPESVEKDKASPPRLVEGGLGAPAADGEAMDGRGLERESLCQRVCRPILCTVSWFFL